MIAHKNRLKDVGRILFWFPLRWIVQAMPFHAMYCLGGWFGRIDAVLSGRSRRDRMALNMAEALGRVLPSARRLVLLNLQHHSRNILELLKYPRLKPREVTRSMSVSGRHHLKEVLAQGKGAIILTAHLGAKQFLQIALPALGYRVSQVHYHMHRNELTFVQKHVAQKQRMNIEARLPVRFFSAKGFLRSAFKCLQQNQLLIMAGDGIGLKQHMDKSYHPMDFLGKKMLFPSGPVVMAKRTGAALVPVFAIRDRQRYQVVICPPIETASGTVNGAMRAYVGVLERFVRQYPWQWEFWEEFEEGFLLAQTQGNIPQKTSPRGMAPRGISPKEMAWPASTEP